MNESEPLPHVRFLLRFRRPVFSFLSICSANFKGETDSDMDPGPG